MLTLSGAHSCNGTQWLAVLDCLRSDQLLYAESTKESPLNTSDVLTDGEMHHGKGKHVAALTGKKKPLSAH
jgi:hypothetical protein